MEKDNRNSIVKKTGTITKYEPQKKSGLVARGLRDIAQQKTVLFVYRGGELEGIHQLFDEEVKSALGASINIVHRYSPADAVKYLISNNVNLIISEIKFDNTHKDGFSGAQLLNVCKSICPKLPFIIWCVWNNLIFDNPKPDCYIGVSSNLSELITAIKGLLDYGDNTEAVNSNFKDNDIDHLLSSGKNTIKVYFKDNKNNHW